jgi:hypothetical protein
VRTDHSEETIFRRISSSALDREDDHGESDQMTTDEKIQSRHEAGHLSAFKAPRDN